MIGLVLAAALDLSPYARNGAALSSAVVRNGQVVSIQTYGAPRGAVFRMASLSKIVTAYAVVQLAHEGRVDLHADVGNYLGDLPLRRYRGAGVTLHHLLTHTSGIDDAFFGNTVPTNGHIPTLEEHFRRRPPLFGRPPGADIVYSNEGLALAGLVVERVAGLPFAEYVRRQIFEPFEMRSSTFAQPSPFRVVPSGAEGEALVQAPSGAMVSTAEDMARLMIALLGDSPVARTLRNQYGLFPDESSGRPGLFHTGRSGHESVLYLLPEERLGVFLVHTGGLDRTLRRRYVQSVVGGNQRLSPRPVNVLSGTYRPMLFPRERIERVAELAADAEVVATGKYVALNLPPFAHGQTLNFVNGITEDGYRIAGTSHRIIVTGPLMEPLIFVRVRWWASGRMLLLVFGASFLVVLSAVFRARGMSRLLFSLVVAFMLAAPVAFLVNYLPRDAASRPLHVEGSARAAATMLMLCAGAAAFTPFAAWRTRVARAHCTVSSMASLVLVLNLYHWNLLGYHF